MKGHSWTIQVISLGDGRTNQEILKEIKTAALEFEKRLQKKAPGAKVAIKRVEGLPIKEVLELVFHMSPQHVADAIGGGAIAWGVKESLTWLQNRFNVGAKLVGKAIAAKV
jgi:hypothetical protein